MLKSATRRTTARRRYYLASADAFLHTGALFLLANGLLVLIFHEPSIWSELLGQVAIVGSLVGGTVLAWLLHGHALKGASWLSMVLGIIVGAAVAVPAFLALFLLSRTIPNPFPGAEGPWGSVLLIAAIVVAFLAVPLYQGVRDLFVGGGRVLVPALRLVSLAVVVVFIVVTMRMGGDAAEIGIFMVPASAASAVGIVTVAWFERWRAARRLHRPLHG